MTKKKEFHFIHKKTLRPSTSSTTDEDSEEENLAKRIKKFHKKKFRKRHETSSLNLPNKFANVDSTPNNYTRSMSMSKIFDNQSIEQEKELFPSCSKLNKSFAEIESVRSADLKGFPVKNLRMVNTERQASQIRLSSSYSNLEHKRTTNLYVFKKSNTYCYHLPDTFSQHSQSVSEIPITKEASN